MKGNNASIHVIQTIIYILFCRKNAWIELSLNKDVSQMSNCVVFCLDIIYIYIYINPSKKVLHIQFGGQYLPQYNIFCYMSYLIMEAWLSSFPMIPISLVYSFSGMNDSFMNGMGVPSVKCQISISAGIGGQYIPQYNIFCYMLYLITGYPAFPYPNIIGVQFQWDEW